MKHKTILITSCIIGLLILFLIDNIFTLQGKEKNQVQLENYNKVSNIIVNQYIQERIHALETLGAHLSSKPSMPDAITFQNHASIETESLHGIYNLYFSGNDHKIRFIYPVNENNKITGKNIFEDTSGKYKKLAMINRTVFVDENNNITVQLPIYNNKIFFGHVLGAFYTDEIISKLKLALDTEVIFSLRKADKSIIKKTENTRNNPIKVTLILNIDNWHTEASWTNQPQNITSATRILIWGLGIFILAGILSILHYSQIKYGIYLNIIESKNKELSCNLQRLDSALNMKITADQALADNERKLCLILQSIPDTVCIISKHGIYRQCFSNPVRHINVSDNDMTGKSIQDVLDIKITQKAITAIDKSLENISSQELEYSMDINNIPHWFQVRITPYRFNNEDCVLWVERDITETRQSGNSLHIKQEQLIEVQKMDAIGRMAGGIAHDFNNMLTTILLYAKVALQNISDNDPIREDLEGIRTAGEQAASLARQLLTLSHRKSMNRESTDTNTVLSEMESMISRILGETCVLHTNYTNNLDNILIDKTHMNQMIMNLAVNARDAMPDGGKFTIHTTSVLIKHSLDGSKDILNPGSYIKITAEDTGIGMDENLQCRIFEPFFTTKGQGKGTGLGLSTVYGIIKQNDGYIFVDSAPGIGTRFDIYLPTTQQKIPVITSDSNVDLSMRGDETILLVEDEESVRNIVARVLRQIGYTVLIANDPQDALHIIKHDNGAIKLMLTDIVMPRISGIELADHVRRDYPEIHVVYMSGYTDMEIVKETSLKTDTIFIDKPFSPEKLVHTIRETLDS